MKPTPHMCTSAEVTSIVRKMCKLSMRHYTLILFTRPMATENKFGLLIIRPDIATSPTSSNQRRAWEEAVSARNPQEITVFQFAKRIMESTKCKSSSFFHLCAKTTHRVCLDTRKIENPFNWRQKANYQEGLARTVAWLAYVSNEHGFTRSWGRFSLDP